MVDWRKQKKLEEETTETVRKSYVAIGILFLMLVVWVGWSTRHYLMRVRLIAETQVLLDKYQNAATEYKGKFGVFPSDLGATKEFIAPIPYPWPPVDSWGTTFRLRTLGKKCIVESAGPDMRFNTPDDIRNTVPSTF